ncbi:hypothetical protein ACH4TX_15730 [Streptomyces sp. NPDC021098]|uniref:hypothetical protein n=1 Tax=unclassified Streptomyces TaxID=2593676 RepID=UPI0037B4E44B
MSHRPASTSALLPNRPLRSSGATWVTADGVADAETSLPGMLIALVAVTSHRTRRAHAH